MPQKLVKRKTTVVRVKSRKKKNNPRPKPKKEKILKVSTKNTLPFDIRIFRGKETKRQYLVYKIQNSYKAFVLATGTDAGEDVNPHFKNKKMTTNQMWSWLWRYSRESENYPVVTQKKRKSSKKVIQTPTLKKGKNVIKRKSKKK